MKNLDVPIFMYGTAWKEDRTRKLTELALQSGFTAIDTANQRKHYFEEAVGLGISDYLKASGKKREDLFIQTKYTFVRGQDHRKPYDETADFAIQVQQSFASSLQHLNTDYIDSYILHGPYGSDGLTTVDQEVWRSMEEIQKSGKIKNLGVSNVNLDQMQQLYEFAKVKPKFAQIRTYASRGWEKPLREFCQKNKIHFQGFSLLTANRDEVQSQTVKQLAAKYGKTTSQIIFIFSRQIGMIPLTGTSSAQHMKEDLNCFDIQLTKEELLEVEKVSL